MNVRADIQYGLVMVIYCRDRGAVKKEVSMDIYTHTQTYGHTPPYIHTYIHTYLNSWF